MSPTTRNVIPLAGKKSAFFPGVCIMYITHTYNQSCSKTSNAGVHSGSGNETTTTTASGF